MFDSVLGRGIAPKSRFGTSAVVTILFYGVVGAIIVWFSTRPPPVAKKPVVVIFKSALPPPPPPPPPPPAGASHPHHAHHHHHKIKKIVQPKKIPQEKPPEVDPPQVVEEAEPDVPQVGGVVGGVPGGVAGGVVGGQIGGQIGGVLSFGEGMTRPKKISGEQPQYTRDALEAHVEGLMIVQCVITTEGKLKKCKILKPLPHMAKAVLSALSTWKMTPVTYQGHPVSVKYNVNVHLRMPN